MTNRSITNLTLVVLVAFSLTFALNLTTANAANLIGLYQFEDHAPGTLPGATSIADSSTASNNGSTVGGVVINAAGFKGQAMENTGSTGIHVDVPINMNKSVGPITFGGWVNPDVNTGLQALGGHDNGTWDRGIGSNGSLWGIASGAHTTNASMPVNVGNWQYLAGTYDGTTATLYYGTDVAATSTTVTQPAGDNENGGNTFAEISRFGGAALNGRVDETFFFDSALNTFEVNAIRNLALSPLSFDTIEANDLFNLFDASSSGTVGGLNWTGTSGLSATNPGEVFDLGGSQFALVLDNSGNGLLGAAIVPEPSTFLLGLLALVGVGSLTWRRRRR